MSVAVKFCGLTRREDLDQAKALGAEYAGVVLTESPRRQTVELARALFHGPRSARRVGVVAGATAMELARLAVGIPLDIIQLHADPGAPEVADIRAVSDAELWAVVRISGATLPAAAAALFRSADAIVLDTRSEQRLGGTGVAFDWAAVADQVEQLRGTTRLVLAGGLTPENVRQGVQILRPDVVDVSSGVESAPGIKDAALMRRFADAVRAA